MADRQSKLKYGEFLRQQIKQKQQRQAQEKQREVEYLYGFSKHHSHETQTTNPISSRRGKIKTEASDDQQLKSLMFQIKSLKQTLSRQGKSLTAELQNVHAIINGLRAESKELRDRIHVLRSIRRELREDLEVVSPRLRPKKKPVRQSSTPLLSSAGAIDSLVDSSQLN